MIPFSKTNLNSISKIQHQIQIKITNYATFVTQFSHSSSSSYKSRWHEEESRKVRVSVWWDFENCNLPVNTNVFRVSHNITAAIRACGIKGPVQITAFGDVLQLSRSNQEALSSTGIDLTHIPRGGKNSADRCLLVDLMHWVSKNPPPAHLFLISGDRDFANILHRLRMNNYNILLASPESAPGVLCSAASIMWQWFSLVKSEKNLTVKHFNQPPDGPYGSWYGHYRGNLEDPFAIKEELSEPLSDLVSDPKGTIPKLVVNHVHQILSSYPNGLSITELRNELGKRNNLVIDKNFYGYKKFSRFLCSMPEILEIRSRYGQYYVCGKVSEKCDSLYVSDIVDTAEKNVNDDTDVKKLPEKLPEITEEPFIEKVEENEEVEKCSSAVSDDGEGYLKRIWKKWFGNFDKVKECEEKSVADVILDEKCGTRIEGNDVQENSEIIEEAKGEDGNTGILSKKSFSKEMRPFMNSSNGADLVLQSRNRCNKGSKKGSKQGRKSVQRSRICL